MKNSITVRSLNKKFEKGRKAHYALKDVTFSVQKGEIFGIMGQSGAGKSTLLRCLSTLETPSEGSIIIEDSDICSLSGADLRMFRKRLGMIFQHFNLLSSRTVAENIALPLELVGKDYKEITDRVSELLILVGLSHKQDAYPARLSGGEKQRVGIARALALNPEILFCDEATSALDPKMTKEILSLLKNLNKKLGITIVLITHQMEVIKQICQRVAVIDKGEIVELGSVSAIFTNPIHQTTKHFLQNTIHDLPKEFLKKSSGEKTILRLSFKEDSAKHPIINELIKKFDISINILQGWIDTVQDTIIGSLTVEISGDQDAKDRALNFLFENHVSFEIL